MKKFLLFSLMAVALATTSIGFTSCSKDDDGNGRVEKDDVLYRTWYKHAGTSGNKNFYDEFIFNSDGTFEYRILTLSFAHRSIRGTYRIVGRTTDYVEGDYIEGYKLGGDNVKTKFTIEFDPIGYNSETGTIMYLERRDDSNRKSIDITANLFDYGDSGGQYHDRENYFQ
jgi:hypothetical protein